MYITCKKCGQKEHCSEYGIILQKNKGDGSGQYEVLAICPHCRHKGKYTIKI